MFLFLYDKHKLERYMYNYLGGGGLHQDCCLVNYCLLTKTNFNSPIMNGLLLNLAHITYTEQPVN